MDPATQSKTFTDSSIALRRLAPLKAGSGCSQTLYLFVGCLDFLVELFNPRAAGGIVAAQFVEHFFDGEFVDFSHQKLLCALKVIS
jgi:hypothetical protein